MKFGWLPEVHFTTQQLGQLPFHTGHADQSHASVGLELDQHVHIAVWTKVVAKHRSEQREPANMVALTEGRHLAGPDGNVGGQSCLQ